MLPINGTQAMVELPSAAERLGNTFLLRGSAWTLDHFPGIFSDDGCTYTPNYAADGFVRDPEAVHQRTVTIATRQLA